MWVVNNRVFASFSKKSNYWIICWFYLCLQILLPLRHFFGCCWDCGYITPSLPRDFKGEASDSCTIIIDAFKDNMSAVFSGVIFLWVRAKGLGSNTNFIGASGLYFTLRFSRINHIQLRATQQGSEYSQGTWCFNSKFVTYCKIGIYTSSRVSLFICFTHCLLCYEGLVGWI